MSPSEVTDLALGTISEESHCNGSFRSSNLLGILSSKPVSSSHQNTSSVTVVAEQHCHANCRNPATVVDRLVMYLHPPQFLEKFERRNNPDLISKCVSLMDKAKSYANQDRFQAIQCYFPNSQEALMIISDKNGTNEKGNSLES